MEVTVGETQQWTRHCSQLGYTADPQTVRDHGNDNGMAISGITNCFVIGFETHLLRGDT